jgi:hypothetical protein
MRRSIISGLVVGALALAMAGPVAAWSGVGVSITGDPGAGSGGGTVVGTGEELVPTLLVSPALAGKPAGDLGPRFQAEYRFDGRVQAVEDVYPYAEGGPVAYLATGGTLAGHDYRAGWRQADPEILGVMVAMGLPATPVAVSATAPAPGLDVTRIATAGAGAALVLALLALVALLVRQPIRSRRIA